MNLKEMEKNCKITVDKDKRVSLKLLLQSKSAYQFITNVSTSRSLQYSSTELFYIMWLHKILNIYKHLGIYSED